MVAWIIISYNLRFKVTVPVISPLTLSILILTVKSSPHPSPDEINALCIELLLPTIAGELTSVFPDPDTIVVTFETVPVNSKYAEISSLS